MNAAEITDKLGLHSLRQRHWWVVVSSCWIFCFFLRVIHARAMVATCIFEGKRYTGGDLSLTNWGHPFWVIWSYENADFLPHISPQLWSLLIHPCFLLQGTLASCLFLSHFPFPTPLTFPLSHRHTSPSGQYFPFCNLIPSKWQLNHLGKKYIFDQFFILFFEFNFLTFYLPLLVLRMKLTNRGIQKFSFRHGSWLKIFCAMNLIDIIDHRGTFVVSFITSEISYETVICDCRWHTTGLSSFQIAKKLFFIAKLYVLCWRKDFTLFKFV